ncbi:hemerythrin domain-containing protein [Mesorhizobium qingshengii]|uniref:Hemerythrin domain-containing protein n=1 Tax=Mesorhizobium qingshengii TaxID=1165689 RepID=A0ABT4R4Q0_9HYPH|nr:hemerythrin domain-containing protein [Mesorhizobium qingshengii]MCZ8548761.1 hemerythrin domain-containing protein [Mesorhizobium qingshengii]
MSRKVEAAHRGHSKVPAGLSDAFQQMQRELVQHTAEEEAIVFPTMRQWAKGSSEIPISKLRREHDDQGTWLRLLESLTDDFATSTAPAVHGRRCTSARPSLPRT